MEHPKHGPVHTEATKKYSRFQLKMSVEPVGIAPVQAIFGVGRYNVKALNVISLREK
jgi:hypothetical protein